MIDKNTQLFLEICKNNREIILILFAEGIFKIKRGNAVLHFDQNGILRRIEKTMINEDIKS